MRAVGSEAEINSLVEATVWTRGCVVTAVWLKPGDGGSHETW